MPNILRPYILLLLCSLTAHSSHAALPGVVQHSLAPMLEHTTPAVVNISTRGSVTVTSPLMRDPFFRQFFGGQHTMQRPTSSLGSGVIVDADEGYVLTNHHVIENAKQIEITLHDGRALQATLVGSDAETDVAVVRIPPEDLTEIRIADSKAVRVGDFVVAIGNPFGLGQTVTSGIISALGRSGQPLGVYGDFIQTDASINPGNSGGALVNLNGELVGINTAIIGPSGGNVGIGFAIPSNTAKSLMQQLIQHGHIERGYIGIGMQAITPELAPALQLTHTTGVLITRVLTGAPADRAGLAPGDVILAIDDTPIHGPDGVRSAVGLAQVGQVLRVEFQRADQRYLAEVRVGAP